MFVILEPEYGTDDTSLFVETTEYRMGEDNCFSEYSKLVWFPSLIIEDGWNLWFMLPSII